MQPAAHNASYSIGGYTLYNDEWGNGHGSQALWVSSSNTWGVFSTQPTTPGVKSYPDEAKSVGKSLNSLSHVTSSFSESVPACGSFESAYDIWLNGSGIEVMLWTSAHGGVAPLCSSTSNLTIDGNTWAVYVGSNGSKPTLSQVQYGFELSGAGNRQETFASFRAWKDTNFAQVHSVMRRSAERCR